MTPKVKINCKISIDWRWQKSLNVRGKIIWGKSSYTFLRPPLHCSVFASWVEWQSFPNRTRPSNSIEQQSGLKLGSGKGTEKATVRNTENFEFILTIKWLNVVFRPQISVYYDTLERYGNFRRRRWMWGVRVKLMKLETVTNVLENWQKEE